MFRAELGNGDRDRAIALLERLKQRSVVLSCRCAWGERVLTLSTFFFRHFPEAVYNRIRGIMLDDAVAPWGQSPSQSQPESPAPSSSP